MEATQEQVHEVARAARAAAAELAPLPRAAKDAALLAIADALVARSPEILKANAADVERARSGGTAEYMIDRLSLSDSRLAAIADAVRHVAGLPDPVGEVVRGYTLPNALEVRQGQGARRGSAPIYQRRPAPSLGAPPLPP